AATFGDAAVVSHDETAIPSQVVHTAEQILLLAADADVVAVDEAQFFDEALVDVCQRLASDGKRVVVAGLDQDYLGRPFEPVPQLMAVAEHVTKLHAVCVVCGAPANHSQRIVDGGHRALVGEKDPYEPRCPRPRGRRRRGEPYRDASAGPRHWSGDEYAERLHHVYFQKERHARAIRERDRQAREAGAHVRQEAEPSPAGDGQAAPTPEPPSEWRY